MSSADTNIMVPPCCRDSYIRNAEFNLSVLQNESGWAPSRLEGLASIDQHSINSLSCSLVLWLNYPNIEETVKTYRFNAALRICPRWFIVFPTEATGKGC